MSEGNPNCARSRGGSKRKCELAHIESTPSRRDVTRSCRNVEALTLAPLVVHSTHDVTRYAAVIFDLDGVVLDSEPIHLAVTNELLALEGHFLEKAAYRAYLGMTAADMWQDLGTRLHLRHPPEWYETGHNEGFLRALPRIMEPAPGLRELLTWLRNHGIRVAVASSSLRVWLEAMLSAVGLRDAFPVVVSGDEVQNSTPDPEVFIVAACGSASNQRGAL